MEKEERKLMWVFFTADKLTLISLSESDIISRSMQFYMNFWSQVISTQHLLYDLSECADIIFHIRLLLTQRNRINHPSHLSLLPPSNIGLFFLPEEGQFDFMDDGPAKLKIIPDHFQVPTSSAESPESRTSSITEPGTDQSSTSRTTSMLKLFTLPRLPWGSDTGGQEKVELTAAQVESLRQEIADIDEREAHLKAR
ncbi:hypothetical protein SESBI_23747 [Sesbania bispinosa]|nr:hypothetical protein SESBI_23747 [Sesbania bispinosa]